MIVTLCTERIRTLDDIRAFLDGNEAADITPRDRESAYSPSCCFDIPSR